MSSNQWELKNRDEVCLLKTNYCTETVYYSLLLRMERREMDCILKNLVVAPIIKAKLKMNHGLLFLPKKKKIHVLVLSFKAMFSALVKVIRDSCIVLPVKQ